MSSGWERSKALRETRLIEPARARPGDSGVGEKRTSMRARWLVATFVICRLWAGLACALAGSKPFTVTGVWSAGAPPSWISIASPPTHATETPGDGLQELADTAVRGRAKFVGGDDLAHVGGEALIIDGDRRAIHVAGRGDDELAEFYRAGARRGVLAERAEVEILAEALTRVDDNGRGFRSEACVENPDTSGAGGHGLKGVEAERVGERGQGGAIDSDAGALENFAVGGEGHEAGEGAGARCGSVGGRGKRTEDQREKSGSDAHESRRG